MFLKSKFWLVYLLILGLSVAALAFITFAKKSELNNTLNSTLAADAKLYSLTFEKTLIKTEQLLDILGSNLLEDNRYLESAKIQPLFAKLLESNESLIGFGLTNTEGEYIAVSDNINQPSLPNLKQHPKTAATFMEALNSDHAVLGRTYFFKPHNSWVIPVRKALRDNQGKVLAVMTTGIRVDQGAFLSIADLSKDKRAVFINMQNFYRTYLTGAAEKNYDLIYETPIAPEVIDNFTQLFSKRLRLQTLEEIMDYASKQPISFATFSPAIGLDMTGSGFYNHRYHVFTIVMLPKNYYYSDLIQSFYSYLLVFIAVNLLILWFFYKLWQQAKVTRRMLVRQAEHDLLTGLKNRNFLENRLKQELANEQKYSLLFIDLDNFKTINDNFGHHIGDLLLKQVAKRLRALTPKKCSLMRFGGDEFVIYLPASFSETKLAESIIVEISQPYQIEDLRFNIGVSVGIAVSSAGTSLDRLLSQADMAMFSAKKSKNTFAYYSDEIGHSSERKMQVEQKLRGAAQRGEIFMVYQPQVTKEGKFYGVEALVRWQEPELGRIPPDEFIDIAEETGLMPKLGRFIYRKVLSEMSNFSLRNGIEFSVSINISIQQIIDKNFYKDFVNALFDSHLPNIHLTLEVTESLFAEDFETIVEILNDLKSLGIKISMDDFGTGYSSLSLLKKLPINELKIDRSFIETIHEKELDRHLVGNIIDIGHHLGITTLAEGVEDAEQLQILQDYHCDLFQGYYYAKPLRLDELEQWLSERNEL